MIKAGHNPNLNHLGTQDKLWYPYPNCQVCQYTTTEDSELDRLKVAAGSLWNRAGDWILGGLCFVLALVLYLQTLAPSVATLFDDSLEFPLAAHDLAIAHPTGYPLYILLGKLFSLAPGPNVAWSVNLLSAASAALTVVFVYLIVRELGGRRLAALLGSVALMLSPVFWSQAII